MFPSFARATTIVTVLLLGVGCVNLEPRDASSRYYVLGGTLQPGSPLDATVSDTTASDTTVSDTMASDTMASDALPRERAAATRAEQWPTDTSGIAVGLQRLEIAPYLDTPQIVTRTGPHEVQYAEFHRWSEALPRAINRVVARSLSSHPGIDRVDPVPWPSHARHDVAVQLYVHRFEGVAIDRSPPDSDPGNDDVPVRERSGTVRVVASWEIIDPTAKTVVDQGSTEHRISNWQVGHYDDLVQHLDAALKAITDDLATRLLRPAEANR